MWVSEDKSPLTSKHQNAEVEWPWSQCIAFNWLLVVWYIFIFVFFIEFMLHMHNCCGGSWRAIPYIGSRNCSLTNISWQCNLKNVGILGQFVKQKIYQVSYLSSSMFVHFVIWCLIIMWRVSLLLEIALKVPLNELLQWQLFAPYLTWYAFPSTLPSISFPRNSCWWINICYDFVYRNIATYANMFSSLLHHL